MNIKTIADVTIVMGAYLNMSDFFIMSPLPNKNATIGLADGNKTAT